MPRREERFELRHVVVGPAIKEEPDDEPRGAQHVDPLGRTTEDGWGTVEKAHSGEHYTPSPSCKAWRIILRLLRFRFFLIACVLEAFPRDVELRWGEMTA